MYVHLSEHVWVLNGAVVYKTASQFALLTAISQSVLIAVPGGIGACRQCIVSAALKRPLVPLILASAAFRLIVSISLNLGL